MNGSKTGRRLDEIKAEIDAMDSKLLKIMKSRAVDGFNVGHITIGGKAKSQETQGYAFPKIVLPLQLKKANS